MEIISIMELIKLIGATCGGIIAIFGFISWITKWPKKWLTNSMKEATKDDFQIIKENLEKTKDTQICVLRHEITDLYYLYKDKKQIPTHAKMDWISLYNEYTKKGGNSYIATITEKMYEWEEISGD